jgi:hypothetical protein
MTRQQIISDVSYFASPLGPFNSLDVLLGRRDAWVASMDNQALDGLLDVLVHPPSEAEIGRVTLEDFEGEVSEILSLLGQRDPLHLLEKVGPFLQDWQARPTIIEVIGSLRRQEGIRWLTPLFQVGDMTNDELIRLAGALGEIGGADARSLLEKMRISHPNAPSDLQREIDVALQSA